MALQKRLKCSKCDRRFSMAAHLGRHMATVHGAAKPKARPARKGRKAGRRRAAAARPASTGFDFSGLSLTDVCLLIDAARAEARRRLEL